MQITKKERDLLIKACNLLKKYDIECNTTIESPKVVCKGAANELHIYMNDDDGTNHGVSEDVIAELSTCKDEVDITADSDYLIVQDDTCERRIYSPTVHNINQNDDEACDVECGYIDYESLMTAVKSVTFARDSKKKQLGRAELSNVFVFNDVCMASDGVVLAAAPVQIPKLLSPIVLNPILIDTLKLFEKAATAADGEIFFNTEKRLDSNRKLNCTCFTTQPYNKQLFSITTATDYTIPSSVYDFLTSYESAYTFRVNPKRLKAVLENYKKNQYVRVTVNEDRMKITAFNAQCEKSSMVDFSTDNNIDDYSRVPSVVLDSKRFATCVSHLAGDICEFSIGNKETDPVMFKGCDGTKILLCPIRQTTRIKGV